MKSPIIYYGGKTSLLPVILPLIPVHEVYTEVFFGGGAVFFAKSAVKNETINDRLDIVINFYSQLKSNFKELNKRIQATCYSRSHHDKALLIIRNKQLFGPEELAWAFWICCNYSYGNKIGGGLKYSNDMSIVPAQLMHRNKMSFTEQLVTRIENAHIENRDAIAVLNSRNVEKAFHYLDPPYFQADQGHYAGYTEKDMKALLDWCKACKGKFLLSNYQSPLLDKYIKKYRWNKSLHTFNNKGMRKHDTERIEVLVSNYSLNNTLF